MANRVILALKVDEELKLAAHYLSASGFEVARARDGAEALELAVMEPPAILIADLDLPVINGERLFQILRNSPHTSNVPFLFISDSVTGVRGFRAGTDILLLRPVNMNELHSRVRQALTVRRAAFGEQDKFIEGKLSHMPVADILQFLYLNNKEGELRLSCGTAEGSVFLKDGHIYNAVLGAAEKEKALFRMLEWNEGTFEFIPGHLCVQRKIKTSAGSTIMEGMRQLDEFKKDEPRFPKVDARVKAKANASALPKGLQPMIYEIVQLAKNYIRVDELVERSAYPDFEVIRAVSALIARGVLEEVKSADGGSDQLVFLTKEQMISIRERIISRYSDLFNMNCGKIFLISTSAGLASSFIGLCKSLPGFTVNTKSAFPQISLVNPLGDSATLRLHGGMDLLIFSIPSVKNMGPLWRAFSGNITGLILIWDEEGEKDITELAGAKRDILASRRIPVVHVCASKNTPDAALREALGLRPEEAAFGLGPQTPGEAFNALFSMLLKEDYVA